MKVAPLPAKGAVPAPPVTVPAVPGVPATPPLPGRAAAMWSAAIPHSGADAKLDQILKKLDALSSPELEQMKKELQTLRTEVDELRKKSTGSGAGKER
jgi:hypothetical protein